jgi:hypothetical protein
MPRGADAQPECIHYIFIFLRQRRIVRGSCVGSDFRSGGLTWMSSNDLEGNTPALPEIYVAVAGTEPVPFWITRRRFPQSVEKRELQLWSVSCYSSPDPYHFVKNC